jgi:hypothetical protein
MITNNCAVVNESTFAFGAVVVNIVVQALPDEIEAMKMVQAFHICGEATTVFGVDLHLIGLDSGFWCFVERNCNTSVWEAVKLCTHLAILENLQSTPNASHAASTSGLPGCR